MFFFSKTDIEQYKCKEYTPQADYYTYTHETFFKLDNFTHSCKLGNDSVNLDLFIISTSSCSILLSTTDSPDYNEPALEIGMSLNCNNLNYSSKYELYELIMYFSPTRIGHHSHYVH